jgi:carboxymethylenebutenolidase
MHNVLIPTSRGEMLAWLAEPLTPGPRPAAIVLHDIFGMTQEHRNRANWLAEAGIPALSIDLYTHGGPARCLREIIRDLIARQGSAFDYVDASRRWLRAQPFCNGRTGIIGFCKEGGFALLLSAAEDEPTAQAHWDSSLSAPMEDFLSASCPATGSSAVHKVWNQGAADQLGTTLQQALATSGEQPQAPRKPNSDDFRLQLLQFHGLGLNIPAAQKTQQHILDFFRIQPRPAEAQASA